jgi:hypothetical protein
MGQLAHAHTLATTLNLVYMRLYEELEEVIWPAKIEAHHIPGPMEYIVSSEHI